MSEEHTERMNQLATNYCTETTVNIPHVEDMSDEAVIHNIRFMAFCAGFREAVALLKSKMLETK